MKERNKVAAGIFGIIFGSYGAHYFYLKRTGKGVLYLLLTLFIPVAQIVLTIIGYVEGFRFLMMTDDEFKEYCKDLPVHENNKQSNNKTIVEANMNQADNCNQWVDKLKEIKNLYDSGILSEEEYNEEKKRIMRSRSFDKSIDGTYENQTMQIVILDTDYVIKNNGKIIVVGKIEETEENVIFVRDDGKRAQFKKRGVDLISENNAVFKKQ